MGTRSATSCRLRLVHLAAPALIIASLLFAGALPGRGAAQGSSGAAGVQAEPPTPTLRDRNDAEQVLSFLDSGPAGSAAGDLPTSPAAPLWTNLVFESFRDGNWEIYLARGDAARQVRLTNHAADDSRPRLNRGATRVLFVSDRDGKLGIYSMKTDGTDLRRLGSPGANQSFPAWSPDGARIAFAYEKDGDWEIYAMAADGSGQSRLTTGGGPDVSPTWSPDGRQIAWIRLDGAMGRIMVMNADGSGQRSLGAAQRYLENLVWSPNGAYLAFDADLDADFWNELAMIQSDGSGPQLLYDAGRSLAEAWMGSWTPDGGLLFTAVTYVVEGGRLYLGATALAQLSSTGGAPVVLPGSGKDMRPDCQSTDITPPSTSVLPLPAVSPAPLTVRWSGSDTGPSGFHNFDVQVRDGASAAWQDWLSATPERSGVFAAVGGHTYYFRSRGRDVAGNLEPWPATHDAMTKIEALPPQTELVALPEYSRGAAIVAWSGSDPGGSGIAKFEIQGRDGASGAWRTLRESSSPGQEAFGGEPGRTLYFRVRGTDGAGNVEAWPPGDGDAHTTIYESTVSGAVADGRGALLPDVQVRFTPAAINAPRTDMNGNYEALVANRAYSITATAAGYGALPAAALTVAGDRAHELYLPPADDIAQGGFDGAGLAPWVARGQMIGLVGAEAAHSGKGGARLVFAPRSAAAVEPVYEGPGAGRHARVVVDGEGRAHVLWVEGGQFIYYRSRSAAGVWSAAAVLNPEAAESHWPDLAIGRDGALHAAWVQGPAAAGCLKVIYATRPSGGAWSAAPVAEICRDEYRERIIAPQLGLDSAGTVHLIWSHPKAADPWQRLIWYASKAAGKAWSAPEQVAEGYCPCDLAVTPDDRIHVVYGEYGDGFRLRTRSAAGWAAAEAVPGAWGREARLAAGPDGGLHLAFLFGGEFCSAPVYVERTPAGVWQPPVWLWDYGGYCELAVDVAVDADNRVHFVWAVWDSGWRFPYDYRTRFPDGVWSIAIPLVQKGLMMDETPGLWPEPGGKLHLAWRAGVWPDVDVVYAAVDVPRNPTGVLEQTIALPAALHKPTLSFVADAIAPNVRLEIAVGGTRVYSETLAGGAWQHGWADLSPWAGQTVKVAFTATGDLTSMPIVHLPEVMEVRLDEVSLGSWLTPVLHGVSPARLLEPAAARLTLAGENFIAPNRAWAGSLELTDVTWLDERTLQATLPAGVGLGRHAIWVANAGGQRHGLAAALSVGRQTHLPLIVR